MPVPVLERAGDPLEYVTDYGFHCVGCARARCIHRNRISNLDCHGCQYSLEDGIDTPAFNSQGQTLCRGGRAIPNACKAAIERGRLYSRDGILTHISSCSNVQGYLADLELEKARLPYEQKTRKKIKRSYW